MLWIEHTAKKIIQFHKIICEKMIKKEKIGVTSLSGSDVMVNFSFLKPVMSFILVKERKMS